MTTTMTMTMTTTMTTAMASHGAIGTAGRCGRGRAAHLSVIDLSTDNVDSGIFEVAAPRATVYPSPTHRYAIVLARGPEDGDDRVHIFDGGIFLVEHDDHYDLVTTLASRHPLEIAEERPIHYVNSHGWTAIFADARWSRHTDQRGGTGELNGRL